MIDYFALALTHALLLVALLRLIRRKDVDREPDSSEEGSAQSATGSGDSESAPDAPRERRGPRARRRA